MESVGIERRSTVEEAVNALLISRLDGAYRLAVCILRDAPATLR